MLLYLPLVVRHAGMPHIDYKHFAQLQFATKKLCSNPARDRRLPPIRVRFLGDLKLPPPFSPESRQICRSRLYEEVRMASCDA